MEDDLRGQTTPKAERPHESLPQGYRQGLITAITVLLGFSLALFRFWGFEAAGEWTPRSLVAAGAMALAVLLQIVALARSLRLEDDEPNEYRKTVRWFTASAGVLLIGMLFATVVFAGTAAVR
jgi:O-antigen ligase